MSGELYTLRLRDTYPWVFTGTPKAADYTITDDDYAVGANTSGGPVTITIPDASTLPNYPRVWFIKRMTDDANDVIIKLANPADSMYGAQFYAMHLTTQGQGAEILLNANGKYTFSESKGLEAEYLFSPEISTAKPSLSGTTLTINGHIDSMGPETTVDVRFRYRDVTDGDPWSETSDQSKSATGAFSDTVTVTAGHEFATQALLETSLGSIYYGNVLYASLDYYYDLGVAAADKLENYWAMQETSGTNTLAVDAFGDDMVMAGGVTIGSDSIDGNTIYKRIFGSNDYGEAPLSHDIGANPHTILIQVDMNSTSGDHTIISNGPNILSLASDGSSIQLNVNGSPVTWNSATPFSGIMALFITNDPVQNRCTLYSCTATACAQRAQSLQAATGITPYLRVGRGASGDSNHQDFEYMGNGEVRSVAIWHRILSESDRISICGVLDTDGGLLVS